MEEDTAEIKTQEDETAESQHPVSSDLTEFPKYNQEEYKETAEDKTTEPEDTIDSNQLDHTNGKTNGIDPALLQSEEPKSKVSAASTLICIVMYTCMLTTYRYLMVRRSSGKIQT